MTLNSNQFFLGRLFDLKAGKLTSDPLNYDPPGLDHSCDCHRYDRLR